MRRGVLFAPRDALEEDPVVFKYSMGYVEKNRGVRGELWIPNRSFKI
jgi:hypothetical protein